MEPRFRLNIPPFFERGKPLSLRIRLTLQLSLIYTVAVLIILLIDFYGIPGTTMKGESGDSQEKAFRYLSDIADQKTRQVYTWLEERDDNLGLLTYPDVMREEILRLVNEHHRLKGRESHPHFALSKLANQLIDVQLRDLSDFQRLEVYDIEDSTLLFSTDPTRADRMIDTLVAREAMKDSSYLIVSTPRLSQDKSSIRLTVAHRIRDNSGKIQAVVCLVLDPVQVISSIIEQGSPLREDTEILVIDNEYRNMLPLAHTVEHAPTDQLLGIRIYAKPAVLAVGTGSGTISAKDYRGADVLAAYRHIPVSPTVSWGLVVKQDHKTVFRPLYERLNISTIIGIVTLLLSMSWIYLIVRSFTRPIEQLATISKQIGNGDFSQRTNLVRKDELGLLAKTFDSMVDKISQWYQELENTVEKRTEQLYESQTLLGMALSTIAGGIWEIRYPIDQKKDWRDTVLHLSPHLSASIGFAADVESMPLGDWVQRIHPSDREEIEQSFEKVTAGEQENCERIFRFSHNDKSYHWYMNRGKQIIDKTGEASHFVGLMIDITEIKNSELENLKLRQRYESLFRASPIAISLLDSDLLVHQWNPAAEKLFGWSEEEVLGKVTPLATVLDSEEINRVKRLLNNREVPLNKELMLHCKDGTPLDLNIYSSVVPSTSDDQNDFVLSMYEDISERKRYIEALKTTEARYALAEEISGIGLWEWNIQEDSVYWSDPVLRMFGIVPGQAPKSVEEVAKKIHPQDLSTWQESVRMCLEEGQRHEIDFRLIWTDGSIRWIKAFGNAEFDKENNATRMIGMVLDITEERRIEEALRKQTALLREMGNIAKVGGWEFDPETGEGTWTEEVARIHDMDPSDPTSMRFGLSFYTDQDRPRIEQAIRDAIEKQEPYDITLELVTGKGNHRWVRSIGQPVMDNGKVVLLRGSFQDITLLRQAEMALTTSEEKYRMIADNSLDIIWQMALDTKFIYVNPAVEKVFGYTVEEFLASSLSDHAPPEEVERMKEILEEEMQQPENSPGVAFESVFRHKNGTVVPVEIRGRIIHNDQGKPNLVQGITRDISERVAARNVLLNMNQELEKHVKLRTAQLELANQELEAFAYSVSHDLRAPLRALSGFSTALIEEYGAKLDEQANHYINRIDKASIRMGELIDALLSLSRVSRTELHPKEFNLSLMCEEIWETITIDKPERDAQCVIQPDILVTGDEKLIHTMMMNLLGNALKFTRTRNDAHIEVSLRETTGERVIQIKDNGVGFDQAYQDKLFHPFQRLHTTDEFEGSGIGLATVERIVKRHGGWIRASGNVGEGASFTFVLEPSGEGK